MTTRRKFFAVGLAALFLSFVGLAVPGKPLPPERWEASLDPVVLSETTWKELVRSLLNEKMYFSALAAAKQMLLVFDDLGAKENAAEVVIALADSGYPFSIRTLISSVDIEPEDGTTFAEGFLFYKGLANFEKRMPRWALAQWERMNREKSPKFAFFQALQKYSRGDLAGAETALKRLLSRFAENLNVTFSSKISRTLARIHFEKREYVKSLDIYTAYLLKLERVVPNDYLEAAWNLYYLERPNEALGMLYNIESPAAATSEPEKYMLRALIYRDLCNSVALAQLFRTFERNYGSALREVRSGERLASIGTLKTIPLNDNSEYSDNQIRRSRLQLEMKQSGSLPGQLQPLAAHLFRTEMSYLDGRLQMSEESALKEAAGFLIDLDENLKYLQFDIAREALSPERVFASSDTLLSKANTNEAREFRWTQTGTFWRDERLNYRVLIKNRCRVK